MNAGQGTSASSGATGLPRRRLRPRFPDPLMVAGIVGLMVLWAVAAESLGPLKLPSPGAVANEFVKSLTLSGPLATGLGGSKNVPPHVVATIARTLVGASMGIALGVALGYLMARYRNLRDTFLPLAEAAIILPPLVVVPFLILWFGTSPLALLGVVVFFAAAYMRVVTENAIRNVPRVQQQFASTLGASRGQVMRTVVLPSIVPTVIGGVRVVLAGSWGLVVVAELIGAQQGLGVVLFIARHQFAMPLIVVAIVWTALIAVVFDALIVAVGRRLTRWMPDAI